MPSGEYYLAVSTLKWLGNDTPLKYEYVTTWYPGVTELSSAKAIRIGAVSGVQSVSIVMATDPVYFVRGKVTGKIASDMRVVITSAADSANPSPLLGYSSFVDPASTRMGPSICHSPVPDRTI